MSFETVALDHSGAVATITLNRPDRMNAYSPRMGAELGRALTLCDGDDEVRAVILTGAGRAFCAGADMGAGASTFGEGLGEFSEERGGAFVSPFDLRKPVIAAINGHAVGIGLTLAMQCDIRLVAEDAKLGFVFVSRGIIPEALGHWIVPRAIGLSKAAELFFTGRIFSGREAESYGLASRALPREEVLDAALTVAEEISTNAAPVSVAVSKRLLWESLELTREESGRKESALLEWLGRQADAAEGVTSFLEKRPPKWTLRPSTDMPEWPV